MDLIVIPTVILIFWAIGALAERSVKRDAELKAMSDDDLIMQSNQIGGYDNIYYREYLRRNPISIKCNK